MTYGERILKLDPQTDPAITEEIKKLKLQIANLIDYAHFNLQELMKTPGPEAFDGGRSFSEAITSLEVASYWMTKGIATQKPNTNGLL